MQRLRLRLRRTLMTAMKKSVGFLYMGQLRGQVQAQAQAQACIHERGCPLARKPASMMLTLQSVM